mgnify:CR=1 FL=1
MQAHFVYPVDEDIATAAANKQCIAWQAFEFSQTSLESFNQTVEGDSSNSAKLRLVLLVAFLLVCGIARGASQRGVKSKRAHIDHRHALNRGVSDRMSFRQIWLLYGNVQYDHVSQAGAVGKQ